MNQSRYCEERSKNRLFHRTFLSLRSHLLHLCRCSEPEDLFKRRMDPWIGNRVAYFACMSFLTCCTRSSVIHSGAGDSSPAASASSTPRV